MSEEQTPDDLTIPDFLLRITGDQDTVPEPLGLQSTIPALPAAVAPTIVPELGVPELHEIAPANEVCTWVHCIQCGDRLYLRGSIADAEDGDNCYCKDCKPDPVPKQLNLAALLHDDVKLGRDWRAGDISARRIAGASPELGTPVLREIIYPGAANRFAALAYAVGNNWPVFPVPPGTRKSYRAGADNGRAGIVRSIRRRSSVIGRSGRQPVSASRPAPRPVFSSSTSTLPPDITASTASLPWRRSRPGIVRCRRR